MCQRKGQAPNENGGEIKGSLRCMYNDIIIIFFNKKNPDQE
jgi:hypothetical protein